MMHGMDIKNHKDLITTLIHSYKFLYLLGRNRQEITCPYANVINKRGGCPEDPSEVAKR